MIELLHFLSFFLAVPLLVLGALLAIPFALVKVTEWEKHPDHWFNIVQRYIDRKGIQPSSIESLSGFLAYGIAVGLVINEYTPSSLYGYSIAAIVFAMFCFIFRRELFNDTKSIKRNVTIFLLLLSLLGLAHLEFVGFSLAYGGALSICWGFLLFKEKALNNA